MRGIALAWGIAAALAGCTAPAPPEDPPQDDPAGDLMTMSDINLYLHDGRPTAGAARKPTFWLHAETFSVMDEEVWAIENARAVIYGGDAEEEIMVLEGRQGRFEQDAGAYLHGGVKAHLGETELQLEDIEWVNPTGDQPGEARSDRPLRIQGPQLQLEAGSIRLYPESQEVMLTEVTGTIRFGRVAP